MTKKKKKSKKKSKINKSALANNVLEVFQNNPRKVFNYKQVAKSLIVTNSELKMEIIRVLDELTESDKLIEVQRGKYKIKAKTANVTGKIDMTMSGNGYLMTDEFDEDVFIAQRNLNKALNGDTVRAYCFTRGASGKMEGEVVEIIERAKHNFVGTIELSRNFAFLVPESKKMPYDLFIPIEKLNGAKNGDKAVGKITDWPVQAKNPFGEIVEVLGKPGEHEVEMHAILAEFGLPFRFNKEIESAAEKIKTNIPPKEYKNRRDFRQVTTFTIDPHDAKDFDDALSLQKLKNGNWEVGVHIADVTHYIKPGTMLDEEALSRATSVYLVDRVVPMLPEKLSNEACSLRPNEEKLCFSAVFELDENAEVKNQWFGKTLINSDRRFSYEEAQEIIESGKGDLSKEVLTLNKLAISLRDERFKHGSIAFDRVEVKFNIDDFGLPLGIYFKEHKEANQLIEEFMLLANKKVAEFIGNPVKEDDKPKTFVYRIHDKPARDKLESFNQFIQKFGYKIQMKNRASISASLNNILDAIQGKREQNVIETLAIRSMAKAEYSTENIGHYGLYFDYYTHFTSPIRRYPDMLVHRLLHAYLEGEGSKNKEKYEQMCKHSSDMEKLAVEAERTSIKYKQVEFMMDKIGQEFSGVISGVTDFGLFVELDDNKCEGLVPIQDLEDDIYIYDEKNYCLTGRYYKNSFQLGDAINVQIVKANLAKKQLDFRLAENHKPEEA